MDERTPLAYLLREAWFAGHCFYVDERVLVPRSPIAELITGGFDTLVARPPARILDLCCGGGCIGIATALALPQAEVVLADLSEQALAVAAENITRFALADRVTCTQSDLFAAIEGRFDLILCNPPYVSDAEYRDLPAEYRHEPVMGLVSADDGLAIPLQVLAQAAHHLAPDGVLVLETGYTWPTWPMPARRCHFCGWISSMAGKGSAPCPGHSWPPIFRPESCLLQSRLFCLNKPG